MEELILRGKRVEFEHYDVLDSTNNLLKKRCKEGTLQYHTVISDRQSCGRGRLGRSFFSDIGGLYMSFLLKDVNDIDIVGVTAAAGVSVAEAIENIYGIKCGIKWVNDLILNGKKVCGILCEGVISDNGRIDGVIVGIGVNIAPPAGGYPEEICNIATALTDKFSFDARDELAYEILGRFDQNFRSEQLPEKYRSLSNIIGADVKIITPTSIYNAKVEGIDDSFGLIITDEFAQRKTLRSGEISIRIK